jgi:hypothetical protein
VADDWRIRIELADEHAGGLLDRLGIELGGEARELARELTLKRLAVSRDGDHVFVYAPSQPEAARASEVIDAVLREHGIEAARSNIEHWLDDEDRWDSDPPSEGWEEEAREHGYAPWEVRVELPSRHEATELAESLRSEGYAVEQLWAYLIVGTATREDAEQLAQRVHGEVEPGGEVVWETIPENPFAVFGGLGSTGTPTG